MNHRSFGTGEPQFSPVPSVRPTHSHPELTVPEPSLISEWNSKLIISSESESENENDVKETTQEQKTVKFNLDQSGVPPMPTESRKRRSEPILNKSAPSQYFQSVENRMPIGSPVMTHSSMTHPHHPTVHQVYQSPYMQQQPVPQAPNMSHGNMSHSFGNGTLELIEVIRKQEIEIHKHKTGYNKQLKQLKQQAQLIQMLKDKLEKLDRPEVKLNESFCQTETNSSSVLIQTEPIPNKRTREIGAQTDPVVLNEDSRIVESPPFHYTKSVSSEPNTNTPDQSESIQSSRDAQSHASIPSRDSVGGNSVGGQAVGDNPRCQRVINDDEDSDSDKELSPEDLRKLMDEINQSTRKKSPQKIFSPPLRRTERSEQERKNDARSENSLFVMNLAPSYGAQMNPREQESIYASADESICGQLARKYGLGTPKSAGRRSSPAGMMNESNIQSGDMSIATANYLYRHGFEGGSRSTRIQTRKSSTNEIIDFDELEKLKKYT